MLISSFFSVLVSPAKAIYAYVLFLIYVLHKQELYGTPREAIIYVAAAHLYRRNTVSC